MTYREHSPERARLAEQERQVAGWLRTMEATREQQRVGRSRRSFGPWLLILAGPIVGGAIAGLAGVVFGGQERPALWLIGGFVGFVAAVALAVRRALRRRDGLKA